MGGGLGWGVGGGGGGGGGEGKTLELTWQLFNCWLKKTTTKTGILVFAYVVAREFRAHLICLSAQSLSLSMCIIY